jgi:thymidylate synthase
MNSYEEQYINLLSEIYNGGTYSKNRTGINTRKIWGAQIHVDLLHEGFPLLTTKKMHWKSVVHELLWMIKGDTNIQYLLKNGVTFWTEWPYQKYLNHCKTLTEPDYDVHIEDLEKNCVREMTQKEFEQEIINNDEFAKKWGSIGNYGYGGMWRHFPFYTQEDKFKSSTGVIGCSAEHWTFGEVDQLVKVIDELKNNPDSRRIIITAWHPYHSNNREDALLPACHNYIQFGTEELTWHERLEIAREKDSRNENMYNKYSDEDFDRTGIPKYRLNCYFNMRSSDTFLGLPFNCAFYGLFTHLIANHLNMIPSQLVYTAADVHLYENHLEQVKLQLTRDIRKLPRLNIKTPGKSIFDIKFEDIEIIDYNPHPAIKGEVAV